MKTGTDPTAGLRLLFSAKNTRRRRHDRPALHLIINQNTAQGGTQALLLSLDD